MRKPTIFIAAVCAAAMAACSSGDADQPRADIGKVAEVKSSFGPEFKVTDVPTTGIDPKLLAAAAQQLPDGLKVDPADCVKFAEGPQIPADLKGNMAAVSAEGAGNRFITIALETSRPLPVMEPGAHCKKVSVEGGALRGVVELVSAPHIEGVQTQAARRVLQATIDGKPQTGEIYTYRAIFGTYQVIVTANPLVAPDKPPVAVDTGRAERLLTSAVAAIRQND